MSEERRGPLSWLATRSIEAVDLDEVLAGVDVDAVVRRVDVAALLDRVDVNALLDRVDVDRLLDRVDVDRLLDRVDPNRLLDRVDPDRLLDRVDPDRLAERLDVQRVVDRVDLQAVVDRAGIADIVADSTGAVAGSVLDVVRRQLVAVDAIVERLAYRLLRRDPDLRPAGPRFITWDPHLRAKDGRAQVTGHYAGPVSRTAAFVVDALVVFWLFTAAAAALTWIVRGLGVELPAARGWIFSALFLMWAFSYWLVSLAVSGRTVGKAGVGLKVVSARGGAVSGRQALVRTLVMPMSFAVLLLGVLAVLVSPRRSAWHDSAARACEVYDWGDRPAELPAPLSAWIDRRVAPQDRPLADL